MAKIQCEVCGGSSLIKKEDRFVCEDCGISYSLEAVKRMLREGKADTSDPKHQNADAGVLPAMSNAHAPESPAGDFEIRDGVLVKYNGSAEDVVIPDGVKRIGDQAFRGCQSILRLTIPGSVEQIGAYAFAGCTRLLTMKMKFGVQSIRGYAFQDCICLTTVTIPDTVYEATESVFEGCFRLDPKKTTSPIFQKRVFLGARFSARGYCDYCAGKGYSGEYCPRCAQR